MHETKTSITIAESVTVPTPRGVVEVFAFDGLPDGKEHLVVAYGNWREHRSVNVRIHSECITGDIFGSKRCDCGPQLGEAIDAFARNSGLLVYLRQEGRGIGLINKLKAYRLQDSGLDTYAANRSLGFKDDERTFDFAAGMLRAMGVDRVRMLSNNPVKAKALEENGIRVTHRTFTRTYVCPENLAYLCAKGGEGGHDGLEINLSNPGVEK